MSAGARRAIVDEMSLRAQGGEASHGRARAIHIALNVAHGELSERNCVYDLNVAETLEDARPSFPMRCADPWEREP
jgi:hypothetical protein